MLERAVQPRVRSLRQFSSPRSRRAPPALPCNRGTDPWLRPSSLGRSHDRRVRRCALEEGIGLAA